MVTYQLITVKRKEVSSNVWAVGEIGPDFLLTRVEKKAPQTQTIHT